jgi:tricorn protease-like protein
MTTLWVLSLADKKSERFDAVVSPRTTLPGAVFSPDGKWVAYASREGRATSAVYVQPFPPTGAKYQISKNEGSGYHPLWSPDGKELFYNPGPSGRLHMVSISTQPSFSFGEAVVLDRPFVGLAPLAERTFDISRDGQRFLGVIRANQSEETEVPQIQVVLNWFEELQRRVPGK